ncbi:MAG: PDZ domain-containing protein [Kofleriaceae bacterium]
MKSINLHCGTRPLSWRSRTHFARFSAMRWLGLGSLVVAAMATTATAAPHQSNPAFLGIGFGAGPGGCTIISVTPNGPAAEAGIRTDDDILAFDAVPLDPKRPCDQLVAAITVHVPGDRVRIDFMRGPVHRNVMATLATRADVLQKRVGERVGPTDFVDVDDPRTHYDLDDHGRTTVVGFFDDRCLSCSRVFDRISEGLKARERGDVFVLAVTDRGDREDLHELRKMFTSPVALAAADSQTFQALAMLEPERAFFMVIDCRGIIRLVTPIAPDSDDLAAAVDDVLAGAEQAEHARSRH